MAEVFELDLTKPSARLKNAVCTIGVFDGVHAGHRYIIEDALADARARDVACIIITFDIDPDELFGTVDFEKILSNDQRIAALAETGADGVVVLPFDDVRSESPSDFLNSLFSDGLPASIHVGSDFRYGAQAAGSVPDLMEWGSANNVTIHPHDLLMVDGERVSSTRIRALLEKGDVRAAAELLGHPYTFVGEVGHGREAGREMGIRTANLFVPDDMRVLADGVYGAYAIVDGKRYRAAVSVGIPPTFEDTATSNMEAHILDFDGDLYGKTIAVEFIQFLRPMQRFDRTEDLIAAINGDISWVQRYL